MYMESELRVLPPNNQSMLNKLFMIMIQHILNNKEKMQKLNVQNEIVFVYKLLIKFIDID